jgi:DNA-binding transcriptional MocR family regulator
MEVSFDEILIAGNSSLTLMHDLVLRSLVLGFVDSKRPLGKEEKIKFICPVPGYDRHFSICEYLNIEMIQVSMNEEGPNMDEVEKLVAHDAAIRGMWCVPKYSNPTGCTYSDEVVDRLAKMPCRAPDFKIIWDNAYAVHTLLPETDPLKNILRACSEAGHAERVFMIGSTSKITFAGSGIAMVAASPKNLKYLKKYIGFQTVGPDKLNQLRHLKFLKDQDGIKKLMQEHARIIKPKFDAVQEILTRELEGKDIATWSLPRGGYFVSLDVSENCAKKVVALAAEAGVKLTPAGATFPHKTDPRDCNIRIAPTFPSLEDVKQATEMLAICVQLIACK